MTKKSHATTADPEEYKRFLETAKQVEASDAPEAFDRAFGKVVKPSEKAEKPKQG